MHKVLPSLLLSLLALVSRGNCQWVRALGAQGGVVYDMIHHGPEVIAGASYGLVHRSANEGSSWIYSGTGLSSVAHIRNLETLQGNIFGSASWGMVFHSTDGGYNWDTTITGLAWGSAGTSIAATDSFLFARTDSGLYRWDDAAMLWNTLPVVSGVTFFREVHSSGSRLFTENSGGLMFTDDYGATWDTATGIASTHLKSIQSHSAWLYAGFSNGDIYYSADNGTSWTATSSPSSGFLTVLYSDGPYLFAGHAFGIGSTILFRSSDDGATWTAVDDGLPFRETVTCLLHKGSVLLAGLSAGGGVFASTDHGDSWRASSMHFIPEHTEQIFPYHGLLAGYCYWTPGYLMFSDSADSHYSGNAGLPRDLICHTSFSGDDEELYLSGMCGLYASADSGRSWAVKDSNWDKTVYSRKDTFYSFKGNKIFYSYNEGVSWDSTEVHDTTGVISALYTGSGFVSVVSRRKGFFISFDGGQTWNDRSAGLTDTLFLSIAYISPYIFVGQYTNIMRSSDFGVTWEPTDTGLAINPLQMETRDSLLAVRGISGFLYLSEDFGSSWRVLDDGASFIECQDIAFHGEHLYLVANDYIWRRRIDQLRVHVKPPLPSLECAVYPNPFSDEIRIELPETFSSFETEISSLMGQVLCRGSFYSRIADVNLTGLPEGIYLLRVTSGGASATKKIIKTGK